MDTKKPFARFYQVINAVFILLCVFAAVGFIVTWYGKGGIWEGFLFTFGELTVGEFLIGFGTAILATYTAMLAIIGAEDAEKNRRQMAQEAEKDRVRRRIKEQLEGLYSPLMSIINYFDNPREHFLPGTLPWKLMEGDIRFKYEFLSNNELREKFRIYYVQRDKRPLYFRGESRKPQWESIREKADEGTPEFDAVLNEWQVRLKELHDLIKTDFEGLSKTYNELTQFSTSESKKIVKKPELKKGMSDTRLFFKWIYLLLFFVAVNSIALSIQPFLSGLGGINGVVWAAILLFFWALIMFVITKMFRLRGHDDPFGSILDAQYSKKDEE